ncbi:MAG: hypothetical protein V3W11_04295 [bacterium]
MCAVLYQLSYGPLVRQSRRSARVFDPLLLAAVAARAAVLVELPPGSLDAGRGRHDPQRAPAEPEPLRSELARRHHPEVPPRVRAGRKVVHGPEVVDDVAEAAAAHAEVRLEQDDARLGRVPLAWVAADRLPNQAVFVRELHVSP